MKPFNREALDDDDDSVRMKHYWRPSFPLRLLEINSLTRQFTIFM